MNIFITYGGLISPLGNNVNDNFKNMLEGKSGISVTKNTGFNNEDLPLGKINNIKGENRFDKLLSKLCDKLVLDFNKSIFKDKKTLFIVSSTKGNLDDLPNDTFSSTRRILKEKLNVKNEIIIISNACISGVIAVNTAADYIKYNKYNNVVVIGIDALSNFITYGFQSLFALSNEASKPFDKERKGISIGEAAGCLILSKKELNNIFSVIYVGGSSSNDANHISGPSRTGEGLYRSINKTFNRANINEKEIDFISAHGTGTIYNDEMESIAFNRLKISNIPMHSLKGYFGHTLGAAGVIELITCIKMMEKQTLLKSLGFEEQGTSMKLNITKKNYKSRLSKILKTASGFGGGNASLILKLKE